MGKKIALAAPTGRAAQRLSEMTGLPAKTIHRLDEPRGDCLWHNGGSEPEHGVQAICEVISELIPKLGFNPVTDVQMLCPMTRGVVGTRNFNQVLQNLLNPPHPEKMEITHGGTILREGDRVIQLKNDYKRSWGFQRGLPGRKSW